MKKVLMIANIHHAFTRVLALGTYLPDFGWEVTLVTPPLGDDAEDCLGFPKRFLGRTKILEVPYHGDTFWFWRRFFSLLGFQTNQSITEQIKERAGVTSKTSYVDLLMRWYQGIFAYPDTEKTWKEPAFRVAEKILNSQRFDAILSSSPFPTSHLVAAELKQQFGIRWGADFRDAWTKNHNYPYGPLRKFFESRLELRILRGADIITAAAPAYAKSQEALHNRPVTVIPNGFDPEDVNVPPLPLTDKFTITYTGSIYVGKQDPLKIVLALERLIRSGKVAPDDFEVRFYGQRQNWIEKEITDRNLVGIVKQMGGVSRREALLHQRESHVLLLLNWEDPKRKGVYPSKLFEYLGARRPVLATGGVLEDDIEHILRDTRAGIYAPTEEQLDRALVGLYGEYKNKGQVAFAGNTQEIDGYSYREVARKFAQALSAADHEGIDKQI